MVHWYYSGICAFKGFQFDADSNPHNKSVVGVGKLACFNMKTNLRKCFTIQTITISTLTPLTFTILSETGLIDFVSIERISKKIRVEYFLAEICSLKIIEMALDVS